MSKSIYAIFEDDENLLKTVAILREKSIPIKEVFSPYPVHGLDKAMGLKDTRLAICSFIYGTMGFLLSVLMVWYMSIQDWPMNIGGKPSFSLIENIPSFVPIIFESSILLAAHGVVLTLLLRSWILPGVKNKNPFPRSTDDQLVLEIEVPENTPNVEEILKKEGVIEIKMKE